MDSRQRRRFKRKLKNFVLEFIATVVLITFFVSATALDTESWIPYIICTVCVGYLTLFAYANNWFRGWCDD